MSDFGPVRKTTIPAGTMCGDGLGSNANPDRALAALRGYYNDLNPGADDEMFEADRESTLIDLLCDLMHLVGYEPFNDALDSAWLNYNAETHDDPDDDDADDAEEPFESDGYCNECCVVTNGECKHGKQTPEAQE